MRLAIILSAILGSSILVSPAGAQVSVATAGPASEQQPAPADTSPPPFPAMPHARPSHRCVNTCGSGSKTAHRGTTHHVTTESHHSGISAHHQLTREHKHSTSTHHDRKAMERKASTRKKTKEHEATLHLSRAAIRHCHSESYRQLMNDSRCRALMTQELKAKEPHHHADHHKRSVDKKTARRPSRHHRAR
jgi:hypothetical protein